MHDFSFRPLLPDESGASTPGTDRLGHRTSGYEQSRPDNPDPNVAASSPTRLTAAARVTGVAPAGSAGLGEEPLQWRPAEWCASGPLTGVA